MFYSYDRHVIIDTEDSSECSFCEVVYSQADSAYSLVLNLDTQDPVKDLYSFEVSYVYLNTNSQEEAFM